MHVMFQVRGPYVAGGGTITAAVYVPEGPLLAGNHRRRDRATPTECASALYASDF